MRIEVVFMITFYFWSFLDTVVIDIFKESILQLQVVPNHLLLSLTMLAISGYLEEIIGLMV